MSGLDEQYCECPICKEKGKVNFSWSMFVDNGTSANWGRYNGKTKKLDMHHLTKFVGSKIVRIRCGEREWGLKDRHEFDETSDVYDELMRFLKFPGGIITEWP